jgi:serine/threonine-protein kinase
VSLAQGDARTAESLAREALEIRRRALGEGHPDFGASLLTMGSVQLAAGRGAEAEDLLRRGLATLAKALPAGNWRIAEARSRLGACLAVRRQPKEAEPLLVEGYEGLLRGRGAHSAKTVVALKRLVSFYEGQGNVTAAATYRARTPDRFGGESSR